MQNNNSMPTESVLAKCLETFVELMELETYPQQFSFCKDNKHSWLLSNLLVLTPIFKKYLMMLGKLMLDMAFSG